MYAVAIRYPEQGAMIGTLDQIALGIQKVVRHPVQAGTEMGTTVLIGMEFAVFTNHETVLLTAVSPAAELPAFTLGKIGADGTRH